MSKTSKKHISNRSKSGEVEKVISHHPSYMVMYGNTFVAVIIALALAAFAAIKVPQREHIRVNVHTQAGLQRPVLTGYLYPEDTALLKQVGTPRLLQFSPDPSSGITDKSMTVKTDSAAYNAGTRQLRLFLTTPGNGWSVPAEGWSGSIELNSGPYSLYQLFLRSFRR